jgi:cytochrome c oxidase cbb3-type subunit III
VKICCLLVATVLSAQDLPTGGGRGGRGSTREFLGLGAAPDPVAAERGAKLYSPNCAFCHGEKAAGASSPDLVRSPLVLHDEKGEAIGPLLLKGNTEKGMPAFSSLTPDQVRDIAAFLHMRVELTANRGTYQSLNVVTGDAKRGEQFFNGACSGCHSATGDLAKIGGRYAPEQLQDRFLWPAGRGGARKATVTLPSGETVTGTVRRLDDFVIELMDSAGAYRSWSREGAVKVEIEDKLTAHRKLLDKYTDANIHDLTAYLVTLK